ncbi:MAG TPA: HDOD domain-containing protein [Anaeromyxobacter sp.]|nr:HDOD domain-containing protein [Anaeromyxobacter sp.]
MVDVERAIADLVERDDVVVPPERGVALGLARLLDGRDVAVDAVARLVSADPGLAAAALAAASALDGRDAPASLPRALDRLGHAALLDLAREAARGVPAVRGPLAARRRAAWRHAAASAHLSRELARLRGLDPDAAWLCGLLHDVGRAAALAAIERLAAGARVVGSPARWDALVERWHVSLGLSLAARLRLPREVVDAIALHHGPGEAIDPDRSPGLVRIVRTAGAIVRALWDDPPADEDALAADDLDDAEADHLAAVVVALPSAVSALDRVAGAAARRGPSPAEAEGVVLHESKGEGVRVRVAGREYAAVGVAPHQLVLSGPAPLGEGALLEVELLERRGLVFHARVLLAWSEGERFGAILMPFALAGPATLDWHGRVPVGATA